MRVRVARYPIAWLRVLDAPHTFSLFSGPAVTSPSCVLAPRMNEILDVITSKHLPEDEPSGSKKVEHIMKSKI